MLPPLTMNYRPDGGFRDTKVSRAFGLRCETESVPFQDFACHVARQFMIPHRLAFGVNARVVSAFLHHVLRVVFHASNPKMFWTDATGIVTVMKNAFSFWNCTSGHHPHRSVRQHVCAMVYRVNTAITKSVFETHPEPTAIQFFDFGPESPLETGRKSLRHQILNGNLTAHSSSWLDCLTGATSLFDCGREKALRQ